METPEDAWQSRLIGAIQEFGARLTELHKTNPWPDDIKVVDYALVMLTTELWDNFFSETEIREALQHATKGISRYAAGEDRRS